MSSRPFVHAAAPADLGLSGAFLAVLPSDLDSKSSLLAALGQALGFPGWSASNWDALADCLTSLDGIRERRVILFHRSLPGLGGDELDSYLDVLDEAVRSWRDDGEHELVVVLPLEQPAS